MGNMFENTDFKKKLSPAEIAMNIPKDMQGMPPEWCAAYLAGYRDGVRKERELSNRPTLEKMYPDYFKEKASFQKQKKKKNVYMMTDDELEARDQRTRDELIVDVYKNTSYHIIDRYDVCYSASLIAFLRSLGWGEKRCNRAVDSIVGQIEELGRYVKRQDENAIAKWCSRHEIPEDVMQRVFFTSKEYRFETEFGIDDFEIFDTEEP